MRIGLGINYSGGFKEVAAEVADLERAGLDIVFVPEAYSFDAVSALGYLAARTERVQLASGILQLYTRTPSLTAMTAAGLDFVSDGRFLLGLGASGPQVIEGFHGVPYDAPIGRTRELLEICRKVWRRERLEYQGKYYQIPLPAERGTGLGKPLKLINHPVRDRIPVLLAALGPKNVELAAEIAEGWQPIFFLPEKATEVWGESLAAGRAKRDPALGELEVFAGPALAIGENVTPLLEFVKPHLALYIGGMGAKGKNFYHTLATKYGYGAEADRIQELYLAGKKEEAAKVVPDALVRDISLVGPAGFVKERIAAFREAGATVLNVVPMAGTAAERVKLIEQLRELL
ncbi:LLM class F420-dependent oxidoreductase [Nocardia farcinica]|uniref:LLM class F420-dependent oxidoreductase n=1 Tax=Nocardia farcinica TaxID=37329 RepID=UPI0018951753|nr:LLM class F420-dependent oxidoreductase [Nocardia farcinica]MBF6262360.1 LLM class F420-dependent oxidoreductase [Nocardia farcinica]MBF6280900.1 LLM class F420-dependent oxidoreductase [Nocardia farcinica]MBF6304644.1 LLM class F420-dependent oxidoreductase [Nocardia farcinica]MBF6390752.1 LLM class F420-dependent oxidoreductase [Nocardia farcinica]MBF6492084.1 LLM class F420-dependent oxidoreductase [Nocardia farcinica]